MTMLGNLAQTEILLGYSGAKYWTVELRFEVQSAVKSSPNYVDWEENNNEWNLIILCQMTIPKKGATFS